MTDRRQPGFNCLVISGHETPEVFQRYNIKDRRDLVEAMEKLAEFHRTEDMKLERTPTLPV